MKDVLKQWLEAQRRHSEGELSERESERVLTALFRALPYHAPTVALSRRVMLELGFAKPRPTAAAWSARALLLVSLLVLAAGLFSLPTLVLRVASPVGHLLGFGLSAIKLSAWWLAASVSIWRTLADIGHLISIVVATPEAMLGLALTISTGVVAFCLLYNLAAHDRSSRYADSA